MEFLSPWLLAALGAVAAPLLLHFLSRKQARPLPFGTLRFLKPLAARSARRSRMENLLLLLLRCAIVALIALAAARPAGSILSAGAFGASPPRTLVILLDRSASMAFPVGGRLRLDLAKEMASASVRNLRTGDAVAVFALDDRAVPVIGEPTFDHDLAARKIAAVEISAAGTDFAGGLREAARVLKRAVPGARQIALLTDAQATGWRAGEKTTADEWRDAGVEIVVARTDDFPGANVAIRGVRLTPRLAEPGGAIAASVSLANHGDAVRDEVLEVRVGEEVVARRSISLRPRETAEAPFEFRVPEGAKGWVTGNAALQGDSLGLDDRFDFVLPVLRAPRNLVLEERGSAPERWRASFFLQRAIAVGSARRGGEPGVQVAATSHLEEMEIDGFSTVFLVDPGALSDRAEVRLTRYLEKGGHLVVFPGEKTRAGGLKGLDFLPAEPGPVGELPAGRAMVRVNDPEHPLFAGVWGRDVPIPPLPQQRAMEWRLRPGGRVLLTLLDRWPFLIEGQRGAGRVLVVNASADRSWGDLPLSPSFLPLVQQITRWPALREAAASQFFVGDPVPPAPRLAEARTVRVRFPDGSMRDVSPQTGGMLLDRAEQRGVYSAGLTGEAPSQVFAVNPDPHESDLRAATDAEIARVAPASVVTGTEELGRWLETHRGLRALWPLLLLAAAVLFGIEWGVSNRAAAQRSTVGEDRSPGAARGGGFGHG